MDLSREYKENAFLRLKIYQNIVYFGDNRQSIHHPRHWQLLAAAQASQ